MEKILKILNEGTPAQIRALFAFTKDTKPDEVRKKFTIWARWYFPKFFPSKDAPFHKDMDMGNINVYLGNQTSFLNIAFRGSSKTTRTKLFIAFCIANNEGHYRKYFKVLSKDISNAKQVTTDVYNMLVSKQVRALYPEIFEKTDSKREETMASFTTATGVKMTADSIGTGQRGDIQDEARPDFVYMDDIEDRLSLMSAQITHKIWANVEEARTGLSKDGGVVYTANYISERGNIHKLVGKIDNKIIVPIEENGELTWSERYSVEDVLRIKKEAEDYEGEYLCKPSASKDVYFDRASLDRQIPKEPIEIVAGLKIFKRYDPSHRIGSGHDVAGGVGLDSSTSVFIDFDCYPAQVIGTYKDNLIKPDAFAYEIARQGKRFGENYIGVEKNYGSTLDILKTIYPTDKIHRQQKPARVIYQAPLEYGWQTNWVSKNTMFSELAQAIENGLIELNDIDLINEAKSYSRNDLMDNEVDPRLTTRHFDLLIACAIAWQMNQYVKKIEKKDSMNYITAQKMMNTKPRPNPAR